MWTAPPSQGFLQCFDQIACTHMSGLSVRSHMNAGQDGFRDTSSKQQSDQIEGHWVYRSVSRRGSIDHTICSLSCKFWHRLSTVAVGLLPVAGRSLDCAASVADTDFAMWFSPVTIVFHAMRFVLFPDG